jgi:hypothetical protein
MSATAANGEISALSKLGLTTLSDGAGCGANRAAKWRDHTPGCHPCNGQILNGHRVLLENQLFYDGRSALTVTALPNNRRFHPPFQ